jgi:PqqD family protein of HPr-rel-A system
VSSPEPFESPATPLTEPRWIAADPASLLWAEWDGQYVLFHRPAGRTHVVNDATWLLLSEVLREPHDLATTTLDFARARELPLDEDLRTYVAGLLLHLEELGLVVRS